SSVLMSLKGVTNTSATAQNTSKMLIAGTLTGKVDISGSIDMFYAGWLITGYAAGLPESFVSSTNFVPANFNVSGDIHNLISVSAIGTDGTYSTDLDQPTYLSGFDLEVNGKLGQMWTLDSFIGAANVFNAQALLYHDAMTNIQLEVKNRPATSEQNPEGTRFQNFQLYRADGSFNNDTFDTPQYLGSTRNPIFGQPDQIRVSGRVQGNDFTTDNYDFYGVALLAGQTVTVQLDENVQLDERDIDGLTTDMPPVARELDTIIETQMATVEGMADDMVRLWDNPPLRTEQESALGSYFDRTADYMDQRPTLNSAIQTARQVGMKRAVVEYNRWFVNYDNRSTLDYVMQRFVPFWMYESRRWPRLASFAAKRPVLAKSIMLAGGDWDYGYTPVPGGFEFNPMKGTAVGATRRTLARDFPELQSGYRGTIEQGFDWFARGG
ncbi:hypothetical protein LCGC14_2692700, partial [marine sediment metagenome]